MNKQFDNNKDYRKKGKKPEGKKFNKQASQKDATEAFRRRDDNFGCTDSNDPRWYYTNEQLLKDTSSLPFSNQLGLGFSIWSTDNNELFPNFQVPGIMAITLQTTLGAPSSPVDPFNVARRNIYTYIRHANSGSANYDAPNLMMYLASMGACYSALSWAARMYGIISFYNQKNRYVPKALLESMGVDYDNVRSHLADFRAGINNYAVRLSSLATPANMPYFQREAWKYSGVYTDGSDLKAQLYYFRPYGFYRYVEPNTGAVSQTGSLVVDRINYKAKMTYEDVLGVLNQLLLPILSSEDFGIMSGDILKAFGQDGITKLSTIDESYSVIPVKDMNVLYQIHNMITLADGSYDYSKDAAYFPANFGQITEDTSETSSAGALIFNGLYHSPLPALVYNAILDTDIASPAPADVMEMTRLVQFSTSEQDSSNTQFNNMLGYTGVDVAMYATIFTFSTTNPGKLLETTIGSMTTEKYNGLEMFDWHPIVYRVQTSGGYDTPIVAKGISIDADLENFTILHKQTLTSMNETAALSLFDVPSIGTWKLR